MSFHGSPFNATIVNKRYSKFTRIEGSGIYTFQNGTVYKGFFKDGQYDALIRFHGKGTLYFTNGSKLDADWELGIASNVEIVDKGTLHIC
jgi:hypothetical protein